MAKDNETQGSQQQAPPAAAGASGQTTGGTPPGANTNTNTTGPASSGTTKGGARGKDIKAPPPAHQPPVLQLTQEMFQQTVAAAVTAALTATQGVAAAASSTPAAVANVSPPSTVVPRKEKKLADFWTSRPTMWFRLFDGQFPATMTEDIRFNALLNHLPSQALPFVDHILRAPGQTPFTRAKNCLVKHYEVSPRDRARTLRTLSSLGDRTPSEMLYYMRSLLPDHPDSPLFEVIFLDLLPADARNAAVKHDVLEDMAEAADQVLAETPASTSISAVEQDGEEALAQVSRRSTPSPFNPRKSQSKNSPVCYVHKNYGRNAFRCASPRTCSMKDFVSRPDNARSAPGNANAGRQ